MHGSPVVLDLDGVIVKSNFVKHDAMLSLFDAYTEKHHQISSYILANGGVRRDLKPPVLRLSCNGSLSPVLCAMRA
jgi:hypothetical protein